MEFDTRISIASLSHEGPSLYPFLDPSMEAFGLKWPLVYPCAGPSLGLNITLFGSQHGIIWPHMTLSVTLFGSQVGDPHAEFPDLCREREAALAARLLATTDYLEDHGT